MSVDAFMLPNRLAAATAANETNEGMAVRSSPRLWEVKQRADGEAGEVEKPLDQRGVEEGEGARGQLKQSAQLRRRLDGVRVSRSSAATYDIKPVLVGRFDVLETVLERNDHGSGISNAIDRGRQQLCDITRARESIRI